MIRRGVCLAMCLAYAAPLAGQDRPADPLARRVTLVVRDVPLLQALLRLRADGAPLAWRGDLLPATHRITVSHRGTPLRAVLSDILRTTRLAPRVTEGGTIVLVPTEDTPEPVSLTTVLSATGVQALDQLLVIGSPVGPLPDREQPVAVTAVSREDLMLSPHRRLGDQLRAYLPGLILWDRGGSGPPPTPGGVRGVASFTARAPKLYVDGVEVASPELFTLLDGRAVERIEMIHGPQGAALYGPDALNGVVQIETRRGRQEARGVAPRLDAAAGGLDRTLDGTSFWREGGAELSATGESVGGVVIGSLARLGGELPLADAWRGHLGANWRLGTVRVEASARAAEHDAPIERLQPLSDASTVRSLQPLEERSAGFRIRHVPAEWFSHTVVAGVHRISGSREPFRSPILPPRLPLGATNERATRSSIRWAGMYTTSRLVASIGVEASRRTLDRSARQADGSADLSALYRESLDARGAFTQVRLRLGHLVLSGGARADRISSVGENAEAPWAATAGASWSTAVGLATLRLRGAWGRALRPPEPGMSQALAAGTIRQEANPALRAERQSGVELGAELHFANGGWLRVTWFDQRADDLLQQVDLRRPTGATRFYQFQNVGAITNRGLEMDGGFHAGRLSAAARVHLVSSRVTRLSPTYTGEFEPGDTPLEVPGSMASGAIRYDAGSAHLEAGATWLGPWTGYDWQLVARAEAGQVPVRDRSRDYWMEYDGVLRPFAGVRVDLGSQLRAWVRAEWPAGSDVVLRDNLSPALGRTLLIGFEFGR